MQEHEIATPDDLDVALAGSALSRRQKLWKAASGHSPRWTHVLGAVLGAVQLCYGGAGVLLTDDGFYVFMIGFGLSLFGFSLFRMQQAQIDALREILRSIERTRE